MTDRRHSVFCARCEARAILWSEMMLDLHEAVDELQMSAERDGVVAELGQDKINNHERSLRAAEDVMLSPAPSNEAPWRQDKAYGGMSEDAAKASWEAAQSRLTVSPKPVRGSSSSAPAPTSSWRRNIRRLEQSSQATCMKVSRFSPAAKSLARLGSASIGQQPSPPVASPWAQYPVRLATFSMWRWRTGLVVFKVGSCAVPNERIMPNLSRLEWVTEAPQLDQGSSESLSVGGCRYRCQPLL